MNLKKYIFDIAKKNIAFRSYARKVIQLYIKAWAYCCSIFQKTDEKLIYFNAFRGRNYSDSPKAIYEFMLTDKRFADYHFVWSFIDPSKYKFLEKNKNTSIVKIKSSSEYSALARAGWCITNYRMHDSYWPKKDQTYVQCWHGTPLKRLGYDLIKSNNVMNTIDEIREKYRTDAQRFKYFISPSEFATKKFISAWDLKTVGKESAIIEEGYPRNDRLINTELDVINELKRKLGINNIGNKKVILYAPTWRDNQHTSGVGYVYKSNVDFDYLQKELADEYIIFFRAHYLAANTFDFEKYEGFIYNVSEYDDVNDLYLVSDILITDYSSIIFDYANLKKPIIFYMYDLEEYRDDLRGFYIDLSELPGNIVRTEKQLVETLRDLDERAFEEKYKKFNAKYNYLDDGQATMRVINKIFF